MNYDQYLRKYICLMHNILIPTPCAARPQKEGNYINNITTLIISHLSYDISSLIPKIRLKKCEEKTKEKRVAQIRILNFEVYMCM